MAPISSVGNTNTIQTPSTLSSFPFNEGEDDLRKKITRIDHTVCEDYKKNDFDFMYMAGLNKMPGKMGGKTIDSVKSNFHSSQTGMGVKSLRKYSLIVDHPDQDSQPESTSALPLITKKDAINKGLIRIVEDSVLHKEVAEFTVGNPSNENHRQVTLKYENNKGISTDSTYRFRMKVEKMGRENVVFFKLKQSEGNAELALYLSRDKRSIGAALNDGPRGFSHYILKEISKTPSCHALRKVWNHFKVRVIWGRYVPLVQVSINKIVVLENIMEPYLNTRSKGHYSEFGIITPNSGGHKKMPPETTLRFDNINENHRRILNPEKNNELAERGRILVDAHPKWPPLIIPEERSTPSVP